MNIPNSFNLLGQTITVEYDEQLVDNDDAVGLAKYRKNTIVLQKNNHGIIRPITHLEHTFLHEMVHFILDAMAEHDLKGNEKFVDVFSGLLHQALSSQKIL